QRLARSTDGILRDGAGAAKARVRQERQASGRLGDQPDLKRFAPTGTCQSLCWQRRAFFQSSAKCRDAPARRRYRANSMNKNPAHVHLRKMSVAFAPPKPKEFESATFTRASVGRLTMGKPQAGSVADSVISGGSHCSRSVIRQTSASTAPAAPSRWPMLALVELTGKVAARPPAQRLMAAASVLSFCGVAVPWALR